uniref:Uncharacterized protein n=1 Tax=Ascaris lumbricoides TaxID=6252 RepID=A0A0M3HKM1_ASCLU
MICRVKPTSPCRIIEPFIIKSRVMCMPCALNEAITRAKHSCH